MFSKTDCDVQLGNEGELYIIDGIGPDIAVFEKNGRFRLRFGKWRD